MKKTEKYIQYAAIITEKLGQAIQEIDAEELQEADRKQYLSQTAKHISAFMSFPEWIDAQTLPAPSVSVEETGKIVQCSECDHVHKWSDRKKVKIDDFNCFICPECDEESYIKYSPPKLQVPKPNGLCWEHIKNEKGVDMAIINRQTLVDFMLYAEQLLHENEQLKSSPPLTGTVDKEIALKLHAILEDFGVSKITHENAFKDISSLIPCSKTCKNCNVAIKNGGIDFCSIECSAEYKSWKQ